MKLNDLEIYNLSLELSRACWTIYRSFEKHYRIHPGEQFIRAIDSIGANIAEGHGRYYYLDTVRFLYNARGSLMEVRYWLQVFYDRDLITKEAFDTISKRLDKLGVKLNNYISANKKLKVK